MKLPADTNPLVLVAGILLAVFFGTLIADHLYASWLLRSFERRAHQFNEQVQQDAEKRRREALHRQRLQRLDTSKGKALRQHCEDWKKNYEWIGTNTVERQMREHCDAYKRYVLTGSAHPLP